MNKQTWKVGLAAIMSAAAGFLGHAALAEVPASDALVYTGRITDNGVPINNTRQMQVKAYVQEGDVSSACVSPVGPVEVVNGHFRIPMENCRAAFVANAGLWVEVLLDGQPVGPRTKVGAVPYALQATHAATADDATRAAAAAGASPGTPLDQRTRPVIARYTATASGTGGGIIPSAAYTMVDFDRRVIDTDNAVTTGANWRFTAPIAGTYRVSGVVALLVPNTSSTVELRLTRNTSETYSYTPWSWTTDHPHLPVTFNDVVPLAAGDTIQVNIYHETGAPQGVAAFPDATTISVVREGP